MEEQLVTWTPQLIADLIKAALWPFTVLVLGLTIRSRVYDSIRTFFAKNSVSEVSATASGISAKFVAAKQSAETKESTSASSVSLPEDMNAEALARRHESQRTEFSDDLYKAIKTHLSALNLPTDQEVDLLARECSLMQSALRYFDISKVMFRSQFNMFSVMANNGGYMSKQDVQHHFGSIKSVVGDAYSDWDWIKYVSYPVSAGIMCDEGGGYALTRLGSSYVHFMSRNPQLVDDLAKI